MLICKTLLNWLSDGRQPLFSRWWARLGTCCSGPASVFGLWPKPSKPSEPASDLHSSSFHTPLDLRLMAVAPNAWLQYYLSSGWLQYLSLWEVLRRMPGCNITSHLTTSHHTLYQRMPWKNFKPLDCVALRQTCVKIYVANFLKIMKGHRKSPLNQLHNCWYKKVHF